MRSRLFSVLSCLFLTAAAAQSVQAVDLSTQRQYYDEAKRALAKGDTGPYFVTARRWPIIRWNRIWPTTN